MNLDLPFMLRRIDKFEISALISSLQAMKLFESVRFKKYVYKLRLTIS